MSKIIEFLEVAGSNPQLSAADYAASIAMLQINAEQKQALLDRDHLALSELLKGRAQMCCHISLPSRDEPEPMQDDEIPETEE